MLFNIVENLLHYIPTQDSDYLAEFHIIVFSVFWLIVTALLSNSDNMLFFWWLGGVVVRALDLRSKGRGFDYRPLHCRATTLGKLFTPMCLCSPGSIIWYLARAFMLMR